MDDLQKKSYLFIFRLILDVCVVVFIHHEKQEKKVIASLMMREYCSRESESKAVLLPPNF